MVSTTASPANSKNWSALLFRAALAALGVQWVVLNILWPKGLPYLEYLYEMGTWSRQVNSVFPYTFASALALCLFSFYIFRFAHKEGWLFSAVFSISLTFAATSLFEEIYQSIGMQIGLSLFHQTWSEQVINISSILVGFLSMKYWRASKILYALIISYAALWIVWVSSGYPQIYQSTGSLALALNVALKVETFALYAAVILPRRHKNDKKLVARSELQPAVAIERRSLFYKAST